VDKPIPKLGKLGKLGGGRPGFAVAMADGTSHWVWPTVSEETLRNAINPHDGNPLGDDW
jgi:hypothetical protein